MTASLHGSGPGGALRGGERRARHRQDAAARGARRARRGARLRRADRPRRRARARPPVRRLDRRARRPRGGARPRAAAADARRPGRGARARAPGGQRAGRGRARPPCRTSATAPTARCAPCWSGWPPPRPWSSRSTTCSGPTTRRSSSWPICCAARRARSSLLAVAYRTGGLPAPVLAAFEAAGRDGMRRRRRARAAERPTRRDALLGDGAEPARARGPLPAQRRQPVLSRAARRAGRAAGAEPRAAPAAELPRGGRRRARPGARRARRARAAARPGRGGRGRPGRARTSRPPPASSPADDARRALDELVASRLVARRGAPRRYRFRHPIVRRAVYESAGAGWRLDAHARAAAALERAGGPLPARAHHLERCAAPGDEAAIAVLAQAGHAAAPRAPAEAARWFEAALRLLPADEAGAPARAARPAGDRARLDGPAGAGAARRCSTCSA